MKLDVTRHPEYPFRPGQGTARDARADAFLDPPPAKTPEGAALREFLRLTQAFAFLERLVQGELLCDLPVHVDRLRVGGVIDPEEEGERLAEAEEGLLDWSAGSIDNLADALDTIGVKVLLLPEGEDVRPDEASMESALRPPPGLYGAFSFMAEIGPAFLAGAAADSPEAVFVLAHEYGHLVADVDPYLSRFCRWHTRTLTNRSSRPEELRADRFARSLLMPAASALRALHDLGPMSEEDAGSRVELLATLFGVPQALVRLRLADLGVQSAGSVVARDAVGAGPAGEGARTLLALPARYVNLALAAYAGHAIGTDVLAAFLQTTESEAIRIAEWAGLSPERMSRDEDEARPE